VPYNGVRYSEFPRISELPEGGENVDILGKVASSFSNALDLILGEDIQKRTDKFVKQYQYPTRYYF
jgi:hypothetical protein